MTDLLLWDCGTQIDLADIDGLLYVPATHSIRPRFGWLAEEAKKRRAATDEEIDRWVNTLTDLASKKQMFASVNMLVVSGTKS